ncbi:tetratricopeptide repeat protein [Streptomyces sp. NBC_01716]|uniref:tetratricopeptide repeat protein n=1 Tax=Streptomyces sp. NBC_01716 TaxID=2975917 RepID=UPI002E2EDB40|nr:tetratricopeptide repeat protein [Streptomyces sp. NBC_01716]
MSGPAPNGSDGTAPEPAARQVVRAEGGFAYGVIGADIHVFGDGRPVYVLRNWQGPPVSDPEWLRELPSRMLSARHEVVPFTGRAHDLGELRGWRDAPRRLSARWLHGPGGQGKSRLAARLAAESAAAGWLVVTAVHGPGTVLPPPGSQDLRAENAAGVLLIVDYADHWPLPDLAWLLSNALLHHDALPARVLLLARDTTLWPAVRATLADVQAATSRQTLEPLADEGEGEGEPGRDDRTGMFRAARDAFAARYGLAAPETVGPPVPLVGPEFGLTLTVHMAALAAVDAHRDGRHPPTDAAGLTTYLLDREHRHWARLSDTPGHQTPPGVMNRAVFAAALTGAVERPTGTVAVTSLGLPLPAETVLADHAVCYPPTETPAVDPEPRTVLEPLTPDRLAEDFVALTLPGHLADYPAHDWAPTALNALLPHTDRASPAPWLRRAMTVLASGAARWPHLGTLHLYPLLREAPWLAVAAGGAALGTLVNLDDIDIGLLEQINAYIPRRDDAELDPAAAVLAVRLAEHWLAATDDPAEQAVVHLNLGWSLGGAGRYDESLAAEERAVALYRDLARAEPARYEADLARALNNHAGSLSRERRYDEALCAIESAVELRRRRLRPGHDTDIADLALTLSNYSNELGRAGRWLEALTADAEALELYADLVESRPGEYGGDLAITLLNFGSSLSSALRLEAAVAATRRAVGMLRSLARSAPAAHEGGLARALTNKAQMLVNIGKPQEDLIRDHGLPPSEDLFRTSGWREEALEAAAEAVEIGRRRAKANPAALDADLAGALQVLSTVQQAIGMPEEAGTTAREAGVFEERSDPRRRLHGAPEHVEYGQGAHEIAEDAMIVLYRHLCVAEVKAHGPELTLLLRLRARSGPTPDLDTLAEALAVDLRLADADPVAHEPTYFEELKQFGWELWWAGRRSEAVETVEQAVDLARALATEDREVYGERLLWVADTLATMLKELGRRRDAREVRRAAKRHLAG